MEKSQHKGGEPQPEPALSRRYKANAIRALSMDAVQRANCGHPGAPMGMADIAEVLWSDFLVHNPANPDWLNRDRFVLSNGHGSMLLYALLHLTGYDLALSELKNFRQLHSKTPGHPEYGYTPGVETTTGPLGQGLANAVGMALGEKNLAARFNRPGHPIIDHFTYVFVGDGCLMEGISHEACSLAGTLGLGKLIAIYDDNGISIDGQVANWFSEDVAARFESYGWQVIPDIDGHDAAMVAAALNQARQETARPSLICCRTVIGFGSPNKAGKESSHGAPLGEEEVARARQKLDWAHAPFEIPPPLYAAWDGRARGAAAEREWDARFAQYQRAHPELAAELLRRRQRQLPQNWSEICRNQVRQADTAQANIASRKASQDALNGFGPHVPELIGGSADLTGSNLTWWAGSRAIHEQADGNYIYFGVREFGMMAMVNGLALYGGFKPYGATFLMFSEYARNALRMAALMKIPSIFVFTHDSVGLGEDGPTHQAVEQLATLRMIPGMAVWRPCDAVETMVAWQQAIESTAQPHCLIFSRQTLPHQMRTAAQLEQIARGGYILKDCAGEPEVILIATGSEVALAVAAADTLSGRAIRVVSMPSCDRFDAQDNAYRESVIPSQVARRVAIEAGVGDGWRKYVGDRGAIVSIETFGESAPADKVFEYLGLTTDKVVATLENLLP